MDQQVIIVLIVAAAILIGVVAYAYATQQRRRRLRHRFGPEYERAVDSSHNVAEAEASLKDRLDRVARFRLRQIGNERHRAQVHELILRA